MKMPQTSTHLTNSLRSGIKTRFPVSLTRRFQRDEQGVAAIEFAIIAPIMIAMYFGLAEIASAISVDRRVSHSTNVAGDLATQTPEVRDGEIEEIVSAALRVLDVSDVSKVAMDMESFILPNAGDPPESRGRIRVNNGAASLGNFDASGLDTKILNEDSGVVVTRMAYKYSPLKLRFMKTDITLRETFLLKPRRSDVVQIQDGMGSLIDCTATSFSNVACTVTN
jgi:Flp pilus assembly protein TadG